MNPLQRDQAIAQIPRRPLVRYHGGKWRLAPWIIQHLPAHRVYVEPFGGGGSVLLRKPRSYAEIYNDLDGEIVNLFRQARDNGDALTRAVELTPFARAEFTEAYAPHGDLLEQAKRTLIRSFMGFGADAVTGKASGFRANSRRTGTIPAHDWMNFPANMREVVQRLRGVVIENRDAMDVMRAHDCDEAVHYVDPPYVHSTRSGHRPSHTYRYELSDPQHRELAAGLRKLRGAVLLSGYRSPLYDELYGDWRRFDKNTHADGARERVESLWLSRGAPKPSLLQECTP